MAYSTSIETLKKMLPQLEQLKQGNTCLWNTEPNQSHKLAYKIREALYIARLNPKDYPELAAAADRFRIEVVGSRQVQARFAATTTEATVQASPTPSTPTQGVEVAGEPRKLMGAQTAASVVQTVMDAQPTNDPLHFPQANMPREELVKLYQFTTARKLIMFVAPDGALTVQRRTRDLEEYAWTPSD